MQRRHGYCLEFAISKLVDFDRLHCRADRNFSHQCPDIRRSPKSDGKVARHREPSTIDGKQLRPGIVIALVSLNIEKGEAGFCVAHGEIEWFARRKFFD